jgi:hypothetical protein
VQITSDDAGLLPDVKATVGRVAAEINPRLRSREVRIYLEGARDLLLPGSLVGARFQVALGPDLAPADPLDRATWGEFVLIPKTAVGAKKCQSPIFVPPECDDFGQTRKVRP